MSQVCRSEKEFNTWIGYLCCLREKKGKLFVLWPWVEVEIGEGTGKHGNQKEEKKQRPFLIRWPEVANDEVED